MGSSVKVCFSRNMSPPLVCERPLDAGSVAQGVAWPDAVKTVVHRAVAVAVPVPRIADAMSTVECPAPPSTSSTGRTVVVPSLVQATAFIEPAVGWVVVDALVDAFASFLGSESGMVANLWGVAPPPWGPPFDFPALPPRMVRAIFNRATTSVALLLSGASRDLMSTVSCSRDGPPLSVWRVDFPDLEDAVDKLAMLDKTTYDVIVKATNAAAMPRNPSPSCFSKSERPQPPSRLS